MDGGTTQPRLVVELFELGRDVPADAGVELARAGFAVTVLADETEVGRCDVVLIVAAAGCRAEHACRALRAATDRPVLVVAEEPPAGDVVACLEAGADDHVVAGQLSSDELGARVRALHRRAELAAPARPLTLHVAPPTTVEVDDLRIDRERHELVVAGHAVHLAPKEFEILDLLAERAGSLVTRAELIEHTWGGGYMGTTKTLDVHIKRLRAKLEIDPRQPERIVTVRGIGFRLERREDAAAADAPRSTTLATA